LKRAKAAKLFVRLAKANFEPVLKPMLDGEGNTIYVIEVHGSGGWLNRSDLARLLKMADSFDEAGQLDFELRPEGPLAIR
jgi:hypothetical protein